MYNFVAKYYDTNSDLHPINSIYKIFSLLIFFVLTIIVTNIMFSIILFLFSIIILILTKVPIKLYVLRSSLALILFVLIIATGLVLNLNTLNIALKILSFSIYYSSYIYTTKVIDTYKGLNIIFSYFNINSEKLSLFFLLLIYCLSLIYSEYYNIRNIRIRKEIKYKNSLKTIYYTLFKVKERIDAITNAFKVKNYNYKCLSYNDSYVGISVLASHLMLFVVYFLGKV